MVWIVVDHDVIVGPIPAVDISHIEGSDAEVVSAEPEATRASTPKPPNEARSEAAFEMAVLPWVVEVVIDTGAVYVMPNPFAILVNVRRLGMSFFIAERGVISRWAGRVLDGPAEIIVVSGRPTAGNITASHGMTGSFTVISACSAVAFMLSEEGYGRNEQNCNQQMNSTHFTSKSHAPA
jgi:hypothetical protein